MKKQGTHEGCIEQMYRLFNEHLYSANPPKRDAEGYIRIDDLEMQDDTQEKIRRLWEKVTTDNLMQETDISGYRDDFYRLFGFNMPGINYDADVDPVRIIESI